MIFRAEPQDATDSVQISASPPCWLISALVCSAGAAEPPSPDSDAPISAMITFAPDCAIMTAMARPTPPPAPVTTATLPSIKPGMFHSPLALRADHDGTASGCRRPAGEL